MKKALSLFCISLLVLSACATDLGPGFSHYGAGYTMQFPNQKWGKVNIDPVEKDGVRFDPVKISDNSGTYRHIFTIIYVPVGQWETFTADKNYKELGRNEKVVFTYEMAQDIPKNMNARVKEVDGIIKTFKVQ